MLFISFEWSETRLEANEAKTAVINLNTAEPEFVDVDYVPN